MFAVAFWLSVVLHLATWNIYLDSFQRQQSKKIWFFPIRPAGRWRIKTLNFSYQNKRNLWTSDLFWVLHFRCKGLIVQFADLHYTHTVNSTHTVHCTLRSVHCTLHCTAHYTVYTAHYTVYTAHYIALHTEQCRVLKCTRKPANTSTRTAHRKLQQRLKLNQRIMNI